jgi:hypothetical protein
MPFMCTGETILAKMGTLYVKKSTGLKFLCDRREKSQMLVYHSRQRGICENECYGGRSGFLGRQIFAVKSKIYNAIKLPKKQAQRQMFANPLGQATAAEICENLIVEKV